MPPLETSKERELKSVWEIEGGARVRNATNTKEVGPVFEVPTFPVGESLVILVGGVRRERETQDSPTTKSKS
jgi:hypothetical protein